MSTLLNIEQYQRELEEIEEQYRRKLEEIERLAARRDVLRRFFATLDVVEGRAEPEALSPLLIARRSNSQRERILSVVVDILKSNQPQRTIDLLDGLNARGVKVGGKDQLQTISRLMSGNLLFKADRKVGWSLASLVP